MPVRHLKGKSRVFRMRGKRSTQGRARCHRLVLYDLLGRARAGGPLQEPTLIEVAEEFLKNAARDHSAAQVQNFRDKWSMLKPLVGIVKVAKIDKKWLIDLRHRRSQRKTNLGIALRTRR